MDLAKHFTIVVLSLLIASSALSQKPSRAVFVHDTILEIMAEKRDERIIIQDQAPNEQKGNTSLRVNYEDGYYFLNGPEGYQLKINEFHPAWKKPNDFGPYEAILSDFDGIITLKTPADLLRFKCISKGIVMPCSTQQSREYETTQWLGCFGADCVIEVFTLD